MEFPANPSRIRQVYKVCNSLAQTGATPSSILATAKDMLGRSAELLYGKAYESKSETRSIDISLLNIAYPVDGLMDQMNRWYTDFPVNKEGVNLLFYGDSGTGKTAFARYIAEFLGMPLIIKKASDLFSMFQGETEKNIRDAFEEAKDCVLIIDEADSFLFDRSKATRSWERTQVNEFLTRMEGFQGLFIATTNFNSILDSASLRRFQYKLEFLPPSLEQRINLFQYYFPELEWEPNEKEKFKKLGVLKQGDFKVVSQRIKYVDKITIETVLNELQKESATRTVSRVGFD